MAIQGVEKVKAVPVVARRAGEIPQFVVGHEYNRLEDIHRNYGGSRQSGISFSAVCPAIFIFSGDSGEQFGYQDNFDSDNVFSYTGEGQVGDMEFTKGNKPFEITQPMAERFISFARSAKESRKDMLVNSCWLIIQFAAGLIEITKSGTPLFSSYERSRSVRDYVLLRASGHCEACNQAAPFVGKDEQPYLEAHHTTRLSDGGPDHPRHVAALCPTCHREIHYGKNGATLNQRLKERLAEIEMQVQIAKGTSPLPMHRRHEAS